MYVFKRVVKSKWNVIDCVSTLSETYMCAGISGYFVQSFVLSSSTTYSLSSSRPCSCPRSFSPTVTGQSLVFRIKWMCLKKIGIFVFKHCHWLTLLLLLQLWPLLQQPVHAVLIHHQPGLHHRPGHDICLIVHIELCPTSPPLLAVFTLQLRSLLTNDGLLYDIVWPIWDQFM